MPNNETFVLWHYHNQYQRWATFSLACHKELKTPVKAEVKQLKHSLSQHNDWTAFCRALVSKSIKKHIESGLLEQKTWTESRNRTNPHVELKLGGSYHQHTRMLQPTGKRTKNGSFLHFESLQRKIFSKRTVTSLVTPCFVRHTYLRTDSHCSLMDLFYLI